MLYCLDTLCFDSGKPEISEPSPLDTVDGRLLLDPKEVQIQETISPALAVNPNMTLPFGVSNHSLDIASSPSKQFEGESGSGPSGLGGLTDSTLPFDSSGALKVPSDRSVRFSGQDIGPSSLEGLNVSLMSNNSSLPDELRSVVRTELKKLVQVK